MVSTIVQQPHLELQKHGTEPFKKAIACENVDIKGSHIDIHHIVGTNERSRGAYLTCYRLQTVNQDKFRLFVEVN